MIINGIALVAAILIGYIIAINVYFIIMANEVFMTTIHGIFLNPLFLLCGSYLGLFILYRLVLLTLIEWSN
ncbi:group-specific protein [Halalkalibacter wakoensis JCM 9140]|uniref:Group-specific protein n=1 Tax=Halalkalibacter wakoensis JCM 9140 TaxID=1236970 RepID=W4Q3N3_9BACI|nr:transposase [Halalkalibacter wakoensis]GAE26555.1 group-specific protein [Halalkalibacter wakoensis JCM 9140]